MSKRSSAIVRTNPLLTGNIKFVVKSDGDFQISTISVNDTLSSIAYTKPLSVSSAPFDDISKVFADVPKNIFYETPTKPDGYVYEKYADMVDQTYLYKVQRCTSMLYDEEFSIFAPLYIGEKLPKYFIIYKSDGKKDRLRDCEILKIIDLHKSPIGKYFQKLTDFPLFENSHVQCDFIQKHVTYTGISVEKSSIVQMSESIEDFVGGSQSVYEFDKWITEGYKRHGLVSHKLFNFEFLFDDPSTEIRYENYFGLYADDINLTTYLYSDLNDVVISKIQDNFKDVDLCLMKTDDAVVDIKNFKKKDFPQYTTTNIFNIRLHGDAEQEPAYNEIIYDASRKPMINTSIKIFIDGKESETILSNTLSNLEKGDYGYEKWSRDGWFLTYYNPFGSKEEVLQRIASCLEWVVDALRLYGVKVFIDNDQDRIIIENSTRPSIEFEITSADGTLSLLYEKFSRSDNNFMMSHSNALNCVGKYVKNGNHFERIKHIKKRRHVDMFDIISDTPIYQTKNVIQVYDQTEFTLSVVNFIDICDFDFMIKTKTKRNDILIELGQYTPEEQKTDPDLSKFLGYDVVSIDEKRPLVSLQSVCKWVSEFKDVRLDEYRLNVSEEFGTDNFSPSFNISYPNPKYYTHEFFPISRHPLVEEDGKMSSYFSEPFNELKYCFSSYDYFQEYFTVFGYGFRNGAYSKTDPQENWSIISKNNVGDFVTFFRGVLISITSKNDIDGYRFSSIFNVNPNDQSSIRIVRNRRFKSIVMICTISYNDYKISKNNLSFLNLYTMGSQSTKSKDGKIIDGDRIDFEGVSGLLKIGIDSGGNSSVKMQEYDQMFGIELDMRFVSYTDSSIEIDAMINGSPRKLHEWYSLKDDKTFMEIIGIEEDLETNRKNLVMFRSLKCDSLGIYLKHGSLTIKDYNHNSIVIGKSVKKWDNSHEFFTIDDGVVYIEANKPSMEAITTLTPKSLVQHIQSLDPKKKSLKWYLVGGGKNFHNFQHEFVNFSLLREIVENNNFSYTEDRRQDDLSFKFHRPIDLGSMKRYGGKYDPKISKLSTAINPKVSSMIDHYRMSYNDSKDTFDKTINYDIRKENTAFILGDIRISEFVYNDHKSLKVTSLPLFADTSIPYDKSKHFADFTSMFSSKILNLPNSFEITVTSWNVDDQGNYSSEINLIDSFLEKFKQDMIDAVEHLGTIDDPRVYVEEYCAKNIGMLYKINDSKMLANGEVVKDFSISLENNLIKIHHHTIENVKLDMTISVGLV